MNDEDILQARTAMQLLNAGRYREAIELLPADLPGLQSFIKLQSREAVNPPAGAFGDLVRGWTKYYKADYPAAYREFSGAEQSSVSWLKSFAWLGKGKVCTDLGFFADAARWCSNASCLGRQFEHNDLVAAANGARGEILLRSGHPRLAAEAFSLDMGLLSAGDRFRGRVLCYQAHAYRRLGSYSAAKLAYRTSAQEPGEQTAPYAYAGLAMLGAEDGDVRLIDEAIGYAESLCQDRRVHPSIAWIYLSKARFLQCQGESPIELLSSAKTSLPAQYVFEHRWLDHWTALITGQLLIPESKRVVRLQTFRPEAPFHTHPTGSGFDSELVESELYNEGIANLNWGTDFEALWAQRTLFLV
jgi:tetratricopeptide (TPR) repeat protein